MSNNYFKPLEGQMLAIDVRYSSPEDGIYHFVGNPIEEKVPKEFLDIYIYKEGKMTKFEDYRQLKNQSKSSTNNKTSFFIEPYGKLSFEVNGYFNMKMFKNACEEFIKNFDHYQDIRLMALNTDYNIAGDE